MLMPDFLPEELKRYESSETGEVLFAALTENPHDVVIFFDCACKDPTWMEKHQPFVKSILRWSAKSYFLGTLPDYYAKLIANIIQEFYELLKPLLYFRPALFYTMTLRVEQQEVIVNSLLFGARSNFFKNLFTKCFENLEDHWTLPGVTFANFRMIEDYLLKGTISDLWKHEQSEIQSLMRQARSWQLPELEQQCAEILKRYITRENVLSFLLDAQRRFYNPWKNQTFEFFNNLELGLKFSEGSEADLKVEILNFRNETLELFEEVAPYVTHLAFGGDLSHQPDYALWIARCPKLIGIDLSGSKSYSNQFSVLPKDLIELNLSACAWVKPETLRLASTQFPHLKTLELASNAHLNFQVWGELNRFHHLIQLNLSRCRQLTDDDLRLIERGCPHLIDLNIEECRAVTNKGIAELLTFCPGIISLDMSRSIILTDKALNEVAVRGNLITQLDIKHSRGYTDRGLIQLLRLRSNLTFLNITGCDFSDSVIAEIRQDYPFLKLQD